MKCFKCHYNIGGLRCAIHGQINLHEHCNEYTKTRIRLYPKPIHIGYDKYDGDME